ncbi:MAG: carboxypeptidase regulatory-like domain-containing protein, partial [Myxococcota bacterium]|nr:carboxypeptidase regulatory-like domain-containing protein [Myxococcota bacterium]
AGDEFGIERFRLSIDRAGVLDVESAAVPQHASWSAGVFLGFAHDPLVIYDNAMNPVDALVDRRLTTGLVGSIGLWNRLQVGAGVDLVGYQHGSDASPTMRALPKAGLGDARVVVKLLLAQTSAIRIALVPTLTVPVGSARGYLRENGVTFAPALAISGARDRIRAAANLGYRLKPRVAVAGLVSDDEAFASTGVGVRLGAAATPIAELMWSASFAVPVRDASANQTAVEMMLGATRAVTSGITVFAAGGVGLHNGFGTPDWRALAGVRIEAAPEQRARAVPMIVVAPKPVAPADTDQDGVLDAVDRCRDLAEDKDGVEDEDGCPDAPAKLAGRIVDGEGRPITGARVTLAFGGTTVEVAANEDGRFSTEYAGGVATVTVGAPEYQPNTVETTVAPGMAGEVEVVLLRAVRQGQLRGQVRSFAGKPLAATVTVMGAAAAEKERASERWRAGTTAQTDADGNFTLDLPQGTFDVTIESPGHAVQRRKITVKLEAVTVLNIDLRATSGSAR